MREPKREPGRAWYAGFKAAAFAVYVFALLYMGLLFAKELLLGGRDRR